MGLSKITSQMLSLLFLFLFLFSPFGLPAAEELKDPGFTQIFTNIPGDYNNLAKYYFKKEQLDTWGIVAGSTLLAYAYDDQIYHNARKVGISLFGGNIHDSQIVSLKLFGQPIHSPNNFVTGMYYIGDGITNIAINLGFYIYGYGNENPRAQVVAYEISEGLVGILILTQILKHTTGRQSPNVATQDRGKWTFFPRLSDYYNHTPYFDAFPSGHVATLTTTMTIIIENYPDHPWVKPMGYGLIGVLASAMLINGVHWASDYPLAIMMGYGLGKVISMRSKTYKGGTGSEENTLNKVTFQPVISIKGEMGFGFRYPF